MVHEVKNKITGVRELFFICYVALRTTTAFLYFLLYPDLGFDYGDIFNSYCASSAEYNRYDILNGLHRHLFKFGCSFGETGWFWLFYIIQTLILCTFLVHISRQATNRQWRFLLLLFLSPTILFFGTAPTKDGFFFLALLLVYPFFSSLRKVLLLLALGLKPYFIIFYVSHLSSFWGRLIIAGSGLVVLFFYSSTILALVSAKAHYITFIGKDISISSLVWIAEMALLLILSVRRKILNAFDLLAIFGLIMFSAGVSFNVSSRAVVLGLLFIFLIKMSRGRSNASFY